MADYLGSLVEQRPSENARRKKWEEAQIRVRRMTGLAPLLAQWDALNQRAHEWLPEMRGEKPVSAPSMLPKDNDPDLFGLPTKIDSQDVESTADSWDVSLELTRAKLRSLGPEEDNITVIIDELSQRAADAEFNRRLDAFRRLRSDLLSNDLSDGNLFAITPAGLFRILPWDWFRARLVGLRRRFRHNTNAVFTNHDRVLLAKFLGQLRNEDAPRLSLSDAERDPDELTIFISLINTLWRVPLSVVPEGVLGDLVRLFDLGARQLNNAIAETSSRKQFSFFSQAIMRSYLLISRIAEHIGREDQASRAGNLAFSFLTAERAGFLASRASFLEPVMKTELEETAEKISRDPKAYLSSITRSRRNGVSNFDVLLNAADILRYKSLIVWRFSHERHTAAPILAHAQVYYGRAGELAKSENEKRLFVTRATRASLLRAAMARSEGYPQIASETMREVVAWIDHTLAGNVDEGVRYLKCRALIAQARSSALTVELDKVILETLRELIADAPEKPGGWALLIDYNMNVKSDPDGAIQLIAEWKNFAESRMANKRHLGSYLAYRRVRILFNIAIADRGRIKEAIEAYIELLFDQPRNTVALSEFVDLMNRAPSHIVVALRPIINEKLPDSPQLTWFHAIMRAMFDCGPTRRSSDEVAAAFSDLLYSVGSQADDALERLGTLLKDAKFADLVAVELASKYYFRRGRQERNNNDLAIADRLLRAGLAADPDDVVWVSRRIDIALQQRAWITARSLLDSALNVHPGDVILKFQLARLQLFQGESERAEATLQQLLPKGKIIADGGAVDFHPAVIDQLALAELRRGRFDEAEAYYRKNLQRQPLDPRGWLGVGRVQFERGRAFWPFALQNWGEALILQADENTSVPEQFTRRTAAFIGGLFKHDVDDPALIASLDALLAREPEVLNFLAPALGSKKGADALVAKFMAVADALGDPFIRRRVAQFLRARTICSVIYGGSETLLSDTEAYVDWCRRAQVLSDYLAGAKGSYARMLVRAHTGLDAFNRHGHSDSTFSGPWKLLADHIATDGFVPYYYGTAEEFTSKISTASVSDLAVFSIWLVSHVLMTFESKHKRADGLLELIQSEIGLISPAELGKLDQTMPPRVSVLVDEDVYHMASRFMNGGGWCDAGVEVHRTIHQSPTVAQIFQFARGGVFFRTPTDSTEGKATAYLNALPEWSRSTFELDAQGTAH